MQSKARGRHEQKSCPSSARSPLLCGQVAAEHRLISSAIFRFGLVMLESRIDSILIAPWSDKAKAYRYLLREWSERRDCENFYLTDRRWRFSFVVWKMGFVDRFVECINYLWQLWHDDSITSVRTRKMRFLAKIAIKTATKTGPNGDNRWWFLWKPNIIFKYEACSGSWM